MNCDGVSNLLSAYLDGELSPGELLRVEEHLRRCHACADEVDSLRQTIALVTSLEEVEVPASFQVQLHERLVALGPPMAAVRRTPAQPVWQRNMRRWAVPAAAAAAALAIGLSALPKGQLGVGLDGGVADNHKLAVQTPGTTTPPDTQVGSTVNPSQVAVAPNKDGNTNTPPAGKENPVPPVAPKDPSKDTSGTKPPVQSPGAQPGQTGNGDGSPGVATQNPQQTAPVTVPAQYVYSYAMTVAGPLDPKLETTIRATYIMVQVRDNELMITVPSGADSRNQVIAKLGEWFPGLQPTETRQDNGPAIKAAETALAQAKKALDQDQKLNAPQQQLDVDKGAVDAAQADLDVLNSQLKSAVFTVQFH